MSLLLMMMAPISLPDVARTGLPLSLPATMAATWEADVPLLTAEGNIIHLLGTAKATPLANPFFVEVEATLTGTTQPDCVATVHLLVRQNEARSLAQKLDMTCGGATIRNAFVGGSP